MEQIILGLITALAPLASQALAAKEKGDVERHAAIVKEFNERVAEALAKANGIEAEFAASDAAFHEKVRALAERLGQKIG